MDLVNKLSISLDLIYGNLCLSASAGLSALILGLLSGGGENPVSFSFGNLVGIVPYLSINSFATLYRLFSSFGESCPLSETDIILI